MTPDPADRKPSSEDMRTGGRVAAVALLVIAALTVAFVWIGG